MHHILAASLDKWSLQPIELTFKQRFNTISEHRKTLIQFVSEFKARAMQFNWTLKQWVIRSSTSHNLEARTASNSNLQLASCRCYAYRACLCKVECLGCPAITPMQHNLNIHFTTICQTVRCVLFNSECVLNCPVRVHHYKGCSRCMRPIWCNSEEPDWSAALSGVQNVHCFIPGASHQLCSGTTCLVHCKCDISRRFGAHSRA